MATKIFCIVCALMFVVGCANLNTIDRETRFQFKDGVGTVGGKAVHLDAKQRIVIQNAWGVVCAEPSPDALTAAAASGGLGISTPSDVNAALSGALSETAASIGLRTQSIQLMRDALYRVCELYYANALNAVQVMMLHQKYQDVMVALLAVEQLTGAVAPKQAGLGTTSKSSALARSIDLGQAVRDSRSRISQLEEKHNDAKSKQTDNQSTQDSANSEYQRILADSTSSATDKENAKKQLDAANKMLNESKANVESLEKSIEEENKRLEKYEQAEDSALVQVQSEASGTTLFNGGIIIDNIDKDTVEKISTAVKEIVTHVVDNDYKDEACLSFLSSLDPKTSIPPTEQLRRDTLENACFRLLAASLSKR